MWGRVMRFAFYREMKKRVRSFGGVGAWHARRNSAVFLRSRDRGWDDAVVFSKIGEDGYFDQTGVEQKSALLAAVNSPK